MDKNAIKKYAVWARRELIERVSQRAMFYGVTSQSVGEPDAAEVNGRLLSPVEKKQRQALIRNVQEKGFEQVMEEVAYTWFNRFAALRFMEVNGYLPSLVRVFTNEAGEFKPQILSEALHLELEGLNKQRVLELESANKSEELFRYLLIIQCNALNSVLPGIFQRIEDYTELLLPDNLLRDGSVIEQLVSCIPEEDWTDQVQIIGWLYQYYNTEPKDKVFADLKKNIKISKENIPAATQLFTPDWIVHYMVENSLGRLWLEGHPNDTLKSVWKYYLDEAEQEPEVEAQLAEIRKEYAALKPEEIRVIDPCCGSGHILVVMFDVLVQIYEDYGYTAREAAVKIVENNLWGLDIDERAAQLSYFAVMMKARQYDRRFFIREVQPHVFAIEESNGITSAPMHDMGLDLTTEEYAEAVKQAMRLIEETHDAKEYGSIIHVTPCDWDLLRRFAVPRWASEGGQIPMEIHGEIEAAPKLQKLINIGEALAQKYEVVVTNPPYMGGSMNNTLKAFVESKYPTSKYDLFAIFIEKCIRLTRYEMGLVTPETWLFLPSYNGLRDVVLDKGRITSVCHLGLKAFDGGFGTVAFTLSNIRANNYLSKFVRLVDYSQECKADHINDKKVTYVKSSHFFSALPNRIMAYWASDSLHKVMEEAPPLSKFADARKGLTTTDNARFLRLWHEISYDQLCTNAHNHIEAKESNKRWFPINKGGETRKWFGNRYYVINWYDDGHELKESIIKKYNGGSYTKEIRSEDKYFLNAITWNTLSSETSFRYSDYGSLFNTAGSSMFSNESTLKYLLGVLNTKAITTILKMMDSSLNFNSGMIAKIPIVYIQQNKNINELADSSIELAREDWDSFEISWDFQRHPLLPVFADDPNESSTIELWYHMWERQCDDRFSTLKKNEEELNRIFNDIYGLQDELLPEVEDKDVTVCKADLSRDIRSFISYAVGCMFGRYSLSVKGLAYAGGEWDDTKYKVFLPDTDGIIPICDDEYFEDDIVGCFVKFVEVVYGKETLEENLRFIADALGGKGSSRDVIRNYFINDFYADHLKVYQKRPIYWLFDSGKKNGFKCLIYMHRYQPDTIARIRTDYVHEQQSRYRTAIADLEHRVDGASPSERVKLTKQLSKVRDQAEELRVYEEKIHHLADQMISIDLDDGVKVNYAKFQDVLAKIK